MSRFDVEPNRYWVKGDGSPGVFINYRQPDVYAARLLDDMAIRKWGEGPIFFASRSIKPGEDFVEALRLGAKHANVMLVVVGEDWAGSLNRGEYGWTHREIVTAQEYGGLLIPIFTKAAHQDPDAPKIWQEEVQCETLNEATLPVGIHRSFAHAEGFPLGTRDHWGDFGVIADALGKLLPDLRPLPRTSLG